VPATFNTVPVSEDIIFVVPIKARQAKQTTNEENKDQCTVILALWGTVKNDVATVPQLFWIVLIEEQGA